MPRQKSSLMGHLGKSGEKAFNKRKGDETEFGAGSDLPPGINGGIAQLVDCKFDTFKKGDLEGEYYFYAAGVVKSPNEHDGVHIEGLRTSIMEAVCETPGRSRESVEDHLGWVLNEFRKLGVKTDEISAEDLEDLAEALKEEQPHFRFRTWIGEATSQWPNPRTQHVWEGECNYDDGETEDDVVDDTDDEEDEEDDDLPFDDDEDDEEVEDDDASDEDDDDEIDYVGLAKDAEKDNEEAQESLEKMASEAGISDKQVENAPDWLAVARMIMKANADGGAGNGAEDDEDVDDENWSPEKEEVYFFKPPRARKLVECEVTAVFNSSRACNLKNLDDGKIYKKVSWDKLEQDS